MISTDRLAQADRIRSQIAVKYIRRCQKHGCNR